MQAELGEACEKAILWSTPDKKPLIALDSLERDTKPFAWASTSSRDVSGAKSKFSQPKFEFSSCPLSVLLPDPDRSLQVSTQPAHDLLQLLPSGRWCTGLRACTCQPVEQQLPSCTRPLMVSNTTWLNLWLWSWSSFHRCCVRACAWACVLASPSVVHILISLANSTFPCIFVSL